VKERQFTTHQLNARTTLKTEKKMGLTAAPRFELDFPSYLTPSAHAPGKFLLSRKENAAFAGGRSRRTCLPLHYAAKRSIYSSKFLSPKYVTAVLPLAALQLIHQSFIINTPSMNPHCGQNTYSLSYAKGRANKIPQHPNLNLFVCFRTAN
jgi:hypothetical protein